MFYRSKERPDSVQQEELRVGKSCKEVTVTLKHVGQLAANVIGHNARSLPRPITKQSPRPDKPPVLRITFQPVTPASSPTAMLSAGVKKRQ
jgi:hypothetical protein